MNSIKLLRWGMVAAGAATIYMAGMIGLVEAQAAENAKNTKKEGK